MNDFKHESDPLTPREEHLDSAIDALLEDKSLPRHRLTPEMAMALRLKTMQKEPVLRRDFDRITEKMLLKEFAVPARASFWARFWQPALAGTLMGALMLAVLSPIFIPNTQPQTIAEVQEFEALSDAEILLGALPVNAETEDGVKIADIREDLHEINELRESADLNLDEDAEPGSFPHTQLRDNALEVIEEEKRLVAMVDISVDIDTFSGKVAEWPTVNEGVDFETHAKAVNGYITHAEAWEEATEEWAKDLVSNLE